jgi:hypothetical protein
MRSYEGRKRSLCLGDIVLITPYIPLILRGILEERTLISRGKLRERSVILTGTLKERIFILGGYRFS